MGVLQQASANENIERFNRARDFFGDPIKRWQDRLSLEGCSKVEQYRRGRMALIVHCEIPSVQMPESHAPRIVHENRINRNLDVFVIFKANTLYQHKLQHWNQKLMLIHDIEIVNSPEGIIPSLVGFYRIQNKSLNGRSDLLLFQSAVKKTFEFLPRVSDWEACPLRGVSIASENNLVVHEIQSTAQVVQHVSDDEGSLSDIQESMKLKPDIICSHLSIFIDMNRVEVRAKEVIEKRIEVIDVLQGPFNLFV